MLVPLPIFHVARPPAWNTDPNIWPGDKNRRSAAAAHENGSMSVSHTLKRLFGSQPSLGWNHVVCFTSWTLWRKIRFSERLLT